MGVYVVPLILFAALYTVSGQRSPAVYGEHGWRVKRDALPIIYDIYSLDHFIAFIEKIERHPKTTGASLQTIVNYVRKVSDNYDNDLWNIILGTADKLPDDILNSEEKRVLNVMVSHKYLNGGSRELGVVRTHEGETIAMGNVIAGISAGLNRKLRLSLAKWAPGAKKPVDNLFTAALTYDLSLTGLAKKNGDQTERFGPAGTWTTNQCPGQYNKGIQNDKTHATDAEIVGGIDSFVLGQGVPNWEERGVRLSQVLRMYYGAGVVYDKTFRSCNRATKFESLVDEEEISDEIEAFAFAYYQKNDVNYPSVAKGDIRQIALDTTAEFMKYYGQLLNSKNCTKDGDDEGCELPANIVFVMDESGSIKAPNYLKEKEFIKNIIKAFDISVLQARVALVEFSTNGRLKIGLDDYGAKTPLLCAVDKLQYKKGWTHTAKAIQIVNDYILGPAQEQAGGAATDTVQIVVLLTDGKSNDPDKTALKREVTRIKRRIKGLTMIAVGVGKYSLPELRMIATKRYKHVFTVESFDKLVELVKSLRKAACFAPALLALDFTQPENDTEIVAYVSPGKPRFFTLPADLFYGINDIYIEVTPVYGTVSVYASRVTPNPGPNNHSLVIEPKEAGIPSTLHLADLCIGYNSSETCPPVYIGIYGEKSDLSCSDIDCKLPNQIKFAIKRGSPALNGSRKQSGGLGTILVPMAALLFLFMRNPGTQQHRPVARGQHRPVKKNTYQVPVEEEIRKSSPLQHRHVSPELELTREAEVKTPTEHMVAGPEGGRDGNRPGIDSRRVTNSRRVLRTGCD